MSMEVEYREPRRRGRYIIVAGVILALVAGAAAFYLINQAQQQAGQGPVTKTSVVVAARTIPARKPIEAADVIVRDVPVDPTNANGVFTDPAKVIGLVPAVTILEGQLVTSNLVASTTQGGQFSILRPDETVGPNSPEWRAVSITVPDDRAVAGMILPGMTVDLFLTATVNVPQDMLTTGKYYTDKSTKIAYQDITILAKSGTFYIIRVTMPIAEEILHLMAAGNATFSMALRPDLDTRSVDATKLGETTNLIIQRYGLPVPQVYPAGTGAIPAPLPIARPSPFPTNAPAPSSTP